MKYVWMFALLEDMIEGVVCTNASTFTMNKESMAITWFYKNDDVFASFIENEIEETKKRFSKFEISIKDC